MSDAQADLEALRDLIQSRGWLIFFELVTAEITADFQEHITRALDVPDGTVALDRMRQVAAVRKAGLRWLKLPSERITMLEQKHDFNSVDPQPQSRRPVGV